jgi:hypothetical protein
MIYSLKLGSATIRLFYGYLSQISHKSLDPNFILDRIDIYSMAQFTFGSNIEQFLRTRQIFPAPQICPNNVEAQDFDIIDYSSEVFFLVA